MRYDDVVRVFRDHDTVSSDRMASWMLEQQYGPLALIAATNPSAKLTDDLFQEGPYGVGIKQGNVQLKRWVDARLNLMKRKDLFVPIIRNNIAPRFVPGFLKNILRPNNNFGYPPPGAPSADTVCP